VKIKEWNCPTIWDPVCGKDGKTYSNSCFAKQAGVQIASKGVCSQPPKQSKMLFQFRSRGTKEEYFFALVTDPQEIKKGKQCYAHQATACIPFGQLASGNGGFNAPWSWHQVPETVKFAEAAPEICDGLPSDVEKHLDYWLNVVKTYCPWNAEIVSISPFF